MKKLFSIYFVLIFCIGVLFVPVSLKWGPNLEFHSKKYVPLWQLQTQHFTIDGYNPIYELDIMRLIYEIGIVTLLVYILYLILKRELNN
ncbi:hypothetical protein M3193_13685 [Sporosarcina luteola]|uniref:hypothetical protein n=1 Tax=Sporosarcina luteola TaxID=582850 RepID=UPI00204240C3|nr:hypothetical protein [Sporosarcina luteola]MCM3745186.1 hypothetical protein [Sporosarcina luteola]